MKIRTLKVAFALLVAFLLAGAPALEAGNKNVRAARAARSATRT